MSVGIRWVSRVVALLPLVLCLILGLLAGCEGDGGGLGSGHDFGDNNPDLYLAMGDSITTAGWPGILSGKLGAGVVNYSQGGAHSSAGAGAVNGLLRRYHPGYLLIFYGANDIINGIDPEVTLANLRYMIQSAKANGTIPVIGTLTPMYASHEAYAEGGRNFSSRIRSLAGSEGAGLADLAGGFGSDASLIQGDGLHPTPAGSERIASIFFSAVR